VLVLGSLLFLLGASFITHPALIPHVLALLVITFLLWGSLIYVITSIGCVDQQAGLFGSTGTSGKGEEGADQTGQEPSGTAEAAGEGEGKGEGKQKQP
jgi:hypothetical protein